MPVADIGVSNRSVEARRQDFAASESRHPGHGGSPAATREEAPAAPVETVQALEPLRKAVSVLGDNAEVQYRQDVGRVVVVVHRVSPETGEPTEEVVRQIPPEEILRLAQRLIEGRSTLIDEMI